MKELRKNKIRAFQSKYRMPHFYAAKRRHEREKEAREANKLMSKKKIKAGVSKGAD